MAVPLTLVRESPSSGAEGLGELLEPLDHLGMRGTNVFGLGGVLLEVVERQFLLLTL